DDRQPWSTADIDSLADQIAIRRIHAGELLIDDRNRLRLFRISRFKATAFEHRHAHRREVSRRRAAQPRNLRLLLFETLDSEWSTLAVAAERHDLAQLD